MKKLSNNEQVMTMSQEVITIANFDSDTNLDNLLALARERKHTIYAYVGLTWRISVSPFETSRGYPCSEPGDDCSHYSKEDLQQVLWGKFIKIR